MSLHHGHSRDGSKTQSLGLQHEHLVRKEPLPSPRPPGQRTRGTMGTPKETTTLAHLVPGVEGGPFLFSKRCFLQKGEEIAPRRRRWPETLEIINTYLSPHIYPLPNYPQNDSLETFLLCFLIFCKKNSIHSNTNTNPCTTATRTLLQRLHCVYLLPQLPLASSAPSDHSIPSPKSLHPIFCQVLPSHTPHQTQEEFISPLLSPTALYF